MNILDAGAFIEGLTIEGVTTSKIAKEVEVSQNTDIIDPKKEFVSLVKEKAKVSGDLSVLSEADVSVLALALEKKGTLYTNDFAVQNVASKLNIAWVGESKSIKEEITWVWYCPACFRRQKTKGECLVCGTETKRRPKSRKTVTNI